MEYELIFHLNYSSDKIKTFLLQDSVANVNQGHDTHNLTHTHNPTNLHNPLNPHESKLFSKIKYVSYFNNSLFIVIKSGEKEKLYFCKINSNSRTCNLKLNTMIFESKKIKKIICENKICHLISNEGNLFSWGEDTHKSGLLGLGTNYAVINPTINPNLINVRVVDISMSETHCCLVDTYREIYMWGLISFVSFVNNNINIPIKIELGLKNTTISKVYCGEGYTAFHNCKFGLFYNLLVTGEIFYLGQISIKNEINLKGFSLNSNARNTRSDSNLLTRNASLSRDKFNNFKSTHTNCQVTFLPNYGFREIYAGKNILILKDNRSNFFSYSEKNKLKKIDIKIKIQNVKVVQNTAYLFNLDQNFVYELIINENNFDHKLNIHHFSDSFKNKMTVFESPYFSNFTPIIMKENISLNVLKNSIFSNQNILRDSFNKDTSNSNINYQHRRVKSEFFTSPVKQLKRDVSDFQQSSFFNLDPCLTDYRMYPANELNNFNELRRNSSKLNTKAISPSHFKIHSIYSVITNINKTVERKKSYSPFNGMGTGSKFRQTEKVINSRIIEKRGKKSENFSLGIIPICLDTSVTCIEKIDKINLNNETPNLKVRKNNKHRSSNRSITPTPMTKQIIPQIEPVAPETIPSFSINLDVSELNKEIRNSILEEKSNFDSNYNYPNNCEIVNENVNNNEIENENIPIEMLISPILSPFTPFKNNPNTLSMSSIMNCNSGSNNNISPGCGEISNKIINNNSLSINIHVGGSDKKLLKSLSEISVIEKTKFNFSNQNQNSAIKNRNDDLLREPLNDNYNTFSSSLFKSDIPLPLPLPSASPSPYKRKSISKNKIIKKNTQTNPTNQTNSTTNNVSTTTTTNSSPKKLKYFNLIMKELQILTTTENVPELILDNDNSIDDRRSTFEPLELTHQQSNRSKQSNSSMCMSNISRAVETEDNEGLSKSKFGLIHTAKNFYKVSGSGSGGGPSSNSKLLTEQCDQKAGRLISKYSDNNFQNVSIGMVSKSSASNNNVIDMYTKKAREGTLSISGQFGLSNTNTNFNLTTSQSRNKLGSSISLKEKNMNLNNSTLPNTNTNNNTSNTIGKLK